MIKLKLSITFIVLLFASVVFAQKGDYIHDKSGSWKERLYFGGGFGLSGGSNYANISLSPIVGYMITSRLSGGVGVTYQFVKSGNYNDNRYGGQLFLRMNLFKGIFLYSSYEFLNYTPVSFSGIEGPRTTVARLPIGAGLSQPIGKRSSINFLAAYDLLYDNNLGAYASPWIFSVFFSI